MICMHAYAKCVLTDLFIRGAVTQWHLENSSKRDYPGTGWLNLLLELCPYPNRPASCLQREDKGKQPIHA